MDALTYLIEAEQRGLVEPPKPVPPKRARGKKAAKAKRAKK